MNEVDEWGQPLAALPQIGAIIGAGFPPGIGQRGNVVFGGGNGVNWSGRWHMDGGRLMIAFDCQPMPAGFHLVFPGCES